jgi:hypothetical protein
MHIFSYIPIHGRKNTLLYQYRFRRIGTFILTIDATFFYDKNAITLKCAATYK